MNPSALSLFENFLLSTVFTGESKYPVINPNQVEDTLIKDFFEYLSTRTAGVEWRILEVRLSIKPLLNAVVKFLTIENSKEFIDELLPTEMNAFVVDVNTNGVCSLVIVDKIIPKVSKPVFAKKSELRRYIKRAHMRYWELEVSDCQQLALAM